MREANQGNSRLFHMTTAYKLSVPVEVTSLITTVVSWRFGHRHKTRTNCRRTAREMRRTWDSLRPSVEAHKATEAKKFDALVAQVESAKTPATTRVWATPC